MTRERYRLKYSEAEKRATTMGHRTNFFDDVTVEVVIIFLVCAVDDFQYGSLIALDSKMRSKSGYSCSQSPS